MIYISVNFGTTALHTTLILAGLSSGYAVISTVLTAEPNGLG